MKTSLDFGDNPVRPKTNTRVRIEPGSPRCEISFRTLEECGWSVRQVRFQVRFWPPVQQTFHLYVPDFFSSQNSPTPENTVGVTVLTLLRSNEMFCDLRVAYQVISWRKHLINTLEKINMRKAQIVALAVALSLCPSAHLLVSAKSDEVEKPVECRVVTQRAGLLCSRGAQLHRRYLRGRAAFNSILASSSDTGCLGFQLGSHAPFHGHNAPSVRANVRPLDVYWRL